MRHSQTKKRLKAKLLGQNRVNLDEQKEIIINQNSQKMLDVSTNIRTKLNKAVKRKRFDRLEYKYFSKHQFVQYLYMMADGGNSFDKIDQETVDSLDTVLQENNSYEMFVTSHSQDWAETDGAMRAFKYLFECKDLC